MLLLGISDVVNDVDDVSGSDILSCWCCQLIGVMVNRLLGLSETDRWGDTGLLGWL